MLDKSKTIIGQRHCDEKITIFILPNASIYLTIGMIIMLKIIMNLKI